ncbi:MAG: lactate utilization protein [Acutalibacteraceae bacterium]|nr:lactate utilization protein [Acutalibacteraceae bacterium]
MGFTHLARKKQAESIIANLNKRNMNGYYCETKEDCRELVLSMIAEGSSVTWGGSESIKECGITKALSEKEGVQVLDRAKYTLNNMNEYYKEAFSANYYLMSTNAITLDGELMNIDGNGNRVASLIFGPDKVIIVTGMNKVVSTIEEAYGRIRNIASPPNTIRLNKKTPCALTGKCGNCMADDCICNQIVVTRRSRDKDRIHVILVNDNLGF